MLRKTIYVLLGLCVFVAAQNWHFYEGPWCAKNLVDIAVGLTGDSPIIYGVNMDYSLVKSTDEGQSWTTLMSDIHIRCVACDPVNADLVYVGRESSDGGIWRSTNGGVDWVEINAGLPGTFVPSAIAMRDAQHIVLGLDPLNADDNSIYYWDARQWITAWIVGDKRGFRITDLQWDPRGGYEEYIYASSDDVAPGGNQHFIGIYQSTDYGHTWFQIGHPDPGQPQGYMIRSEALSICCGLNGYLFAGYRPEEGTHTDGGVMRTTTGGANWSRVLHEDWLPVTDVLGDPINADKVYATFGSGYYSYDGKGVYRNTNAGDFGLWHPFNDNLTDFYTNVLATIKVNLQDHLYVATENSFFVCNLTSQSSWYERTEGMCLPKVIAVEPRIPDYLAFSDKANYNSPDNGVNWYTNSTVASVSENLSAGSHPVLNNEMLKWTKIYAPTLEYHLYHSSDCGYVWSTVYQEINDVIPPIPNIDYCHSSPERVYTFSNHSSNWERYILRSDNTGYTWSEYPTDLALCEIFSVACDYTLNHKNHIFITGTYLIHESTDGGSSWLYKSPALQFTWGEIAFDPYSSDRLLSELASSYNTTPIWYKTTDAGCNWQEISTNPAHCPGPFIIDYEEPSIVYAALRNPVNDYHDVFFSVDYGHVWHEDNRDFPNTRVWDLKVDPNAPQYLYAGTDSGIYYYAPPFNKHLVSSSQLATSSNNAKKMIRGGINDFWITYESGGVIYTVHSSNGGLTWSRKMEIGEGKNPAIASNPDLETPNPGIVWRADNGRDTLYFSRHITNTTWTTPIAIVSTDGSFGPPSFVIGNDDIGRIVYEHDDRIYYTQFDIMLPVPVTDPFIGSGSNPGIGFMITGFMNPEIHVAWEDNGAIKYRSRTLSGVWGNEETVFSDNSSHPSIEIGGTNVYVVWERLGNIHYRYAVYSGGLHYWSRYEVPCSTPGISFYPVLTGGSAISWTEFIDETYYEIYFCYYDAGTGWSDFVNMSESSEPAKYSHIAHKQILDRTEVYFIWTEMHNDIVGLYDIEFDIYSFGGSNPDIDLAFYTAEAGEEEPSPYNLQRDGYQQFGNEPYKRIDHDSTHLEYRFELLNPKKTYALAAYVYQEGFATIPLTIKIGNNVISGITLPPETLIIRRAVLPHDFYTDSSLTVKISGSPAICGVLAIHEYDPDSTYGGGPQSAGNTPYDNKITMNAYPNPAMGVFDISYTINSSHDILISLFDVTGRMMKHVINTKRAAGSYRESVNMEDLIPGVYFVRMETDNQATVVKVILLK